MSAARVGAATVGVEATGSRGTGSGRRQVASVRGPMKRRMRDATATSRATMRDLGFGPGPLALATLGGAVPSLAAAALVGADGTGLLAAAVASCVTAVAVVAIGMRRVRRAFAAPIEAIGRALEHVRAQGSAPPDLPEHGAPLIHPVLRRFNQAFATVQQREQQSRANLMSVEAAFERLHSVLQSLREGVVVIDRDGRVVLANRSARTLLQAESGHREGQLLEELLPDAVREAVRRGIDATASKRGEEFRVTDVGHGDRLFDVSVTEMRGTRPDHDFGRVVVFVDVTRNHELARLKDDLLSSISHELRTPLTNMCSSSEILASMELQDEQEWREFARTLHSESHRLKAMVDAVVLYAQIETGTVVWNRCEQDLAALAGEVVAAAREDAARRGIELSAELPANAVTACVDRGHMAGVLHRLVDNALRFTPAGGRVLVTVSTGAGMAQVAVADSGKGIPPEQRPGVFECLHQLGDVLTGKPAGLGLGLSICQRTVDAMGGAIWCEDSPLGGVQFRFAVPSRTAEPDQHAAAPASA
jgi:two-component system phosphate regulon sensor histidine kinase PhoR